MSIQRAGPISTNSSATPSSSSQRAGVPRWANTGRSFVAYSGAEALWRHSLGEDPHVQSASETGQALAGAAAEKPARQATSSSLHQEEGR